MARRGGAVGVKGRPGVGAGVGTGVRGGVAVGVGVEPTGRGPLHPSLSDVPRFPTGQGRAAPS